MLDERGLADITTSGSVDDALGKLSLLPGRRRAR